MLEAFLSLSLGHMCSQNIIAIEFSEYVFLFFCGLLFENAINEKRTAEDFKIKRYIMGNN